LPDNGVQRLIPPRVRITDVRHMHGPDRECYIWNYERFGSNTGGISDCCKITNPGFERYVGDRPIEQAGATRVVPDEPIAPRYFIEVGVPRALV
jgi:hypothetical protein